MLVHRLATRTDVEDRREAARIVRDVAEIQPNVIDEDMISWFVDQATPADPTRQMRATADVALDYPTGRTSHRQPVQTGT
jgi:hypothetical protein